MALTLLHLTIEHFNLERTRIFVPCLSSQHRICVEMKVYFGCPLFPAAYSCRLPWLSLLPQLVQRAQGRDRNGMAQQRDAIISQISRILNKFIRNVESLNNVSLSQRLLCYVCLYCPPWRRVPTQCWNMEQPHGKKWFCYANKIRDNN